VPDGTSIELTSSMRVTVAIAAAVLLAACRGERVPRDYQNTPPAVTHPVTSSQQTPTAHGLPGPSAEPSTGVEGKSQAPPARLKDQAPSSTEPAPPVTNTQHVTQTSGAAVTTGTHVAARP
jgi:hypothetical protein